MKKVNTCLSGIWNSLLGDVIEFKREGHASVSEHVNSDASASYNKQLYEKISGFCNAMDEDCLEHLRVFYRELGKHGSTFAQATQSAFKEGDSCALCVGCIGCAEQFYKGILSDEEKNDH